jgi:serine/threonine-protein kinase
VTAIHCPSCRAENEGASESCFRCGRNLYALVEGAVLSARYEILRPLGQGGMGIVYLAKDRDLDETVAIKVLRPEVAGSEDLTRRFLAEIKLARKVTHPNVCRIHEYQHDGHLHYIVMERVDGVDLSRLVRGQGPFPPAEAYAIAIRVAGALQAIHDVGIVHRDLKTANIMRDGGGVIRVMDFGLAKSLGSSGTGNTATGTVVGTPEYMSPEQAQGLSLDVRSDVYALGIVTFELFTGRVPLSADSPLATLYKQINDPPPLEGPEAERLPKGVVPVLARALAKSREERYASAGEMAQALEAARSATALQLPAAAVPATTAQAIPRPRPPIAVGVAAAAIVALLAGVAFLRWEGRTPTPPARVTTVDDRATPVTAATATRVVRLNALPWAHVQITAADPKAAAPAIPDGERTTPCRLALADGDYEVTLENGGLTPNLVRRIEVRAGAANEFSFNMPGYDPEAR